MKENKTEKTKKICQLGCKSRKDRTTQHQQERLWVCSPCSGSWELYPVSSLDPRGLLLPGLGIELWGLTRKGQGVMSAWCCSQATDPAPGGTPWPLRYPLLTPAALNPVHLRWCSCHFGTLVTATQSPVGWDFLVGEAVSPHTEVQHPGLVPESSQKTNTLMYKMNKCVAKPEFGLLQGWLG